MCSAAFHNKDWQMLINGKQYDDLEMTIIASALRIVSKTYGPGIAKNLLDSMALDFELEAEQYYVAPQCWPDSEIDWPIQCISLGYKNEKQEQQHGYQFWPVWWADFRHLFCCNMLFDCNRVFRVSNILGCWNTYCLELWLHSQVDVSTQA